LLSTIQICAEVHEHRFSVSHCLPKLFRTPTKQIDGRYYSAFKYAQYFATRHPTIIEDAQAVELVIESKKRAKSVAPPMPDRRPSFFRRLSLGRRKSTALIHHDIEKMPARPRTAEIDRRTSGIGPFSRRPSTAVLQGRSVSDQGAQHPMDSLSPRASVSWAGPFSRRPSTAPGKRTSVADHAALHPMDGIDRRTSAVGPLSRRPSTDPNRIESVDEKVL